MKLRFGCIALFLMLVPSLYATGDTSVQSQLIAQTSQVIDLTQDFARLQNKVQSLKLAEKSALNKQAPRTRALRNELTEQYRALTAAQKIYGQPGTLTLPPHTRLKIYLHVHYVRGRLSGADPTSSTYYHWDNRDFRIPYYSEVLKYNALHPDDDSPVSMCLDYLSGNAPFESFGPEEKKVMLAIDPRAETTVVTQAHCPIEDILRGIPRPTEPGPQSVTGTELWAETEIFNNRGWGATDRFIGTLYNPTDHPETVDVSRFMLRPNEGMDVAVMYRQGPFEELNKAVEVLSYVGVQ